MKAILVNYQYDPEWLSDYPDIEPTIYDRSDDQDANFLREKLATYGLVIRTDNLGDVDYDKLMYLAENYDTLPEVFIWGKTNIFKFVDEKMLEETLKNSQFKLFKPLLKQDHKTYSDRYGQVCFYRSGMYYERADGWFFNCTTNKYFSSWDQWTTHWGLPKVAYVPFAPGGNYLLTRERVHRFSRDFYKEMAETMPHCTRPAEAQAAERSYYLMWG